MKLIKIFLTTLLLGLHSYGSEYPVAVTAEQIEMSRNFLLQCKDFKEDYPEAYLYTKKMKVRVIVYNVNQPGVCAEYFGYNKSDFIIMYPISLSPTYSLERCGQSSMMILAHEMLHQAGLPLHNRYDNPLDFERLDAINRLITQCEIRALDEKRPTSWEGSSVPSPLLLKLEEEKGLLLQIEYMLRDLLMGEVFHE